MTLRHQGLNHEQLAKGESESPSMSAVYVIGAFIVVAILYATLCTRYRESWCAREGFEDLGKVSDDWYLRLRAHQQCFGAGDVGHVGSCLRKIIDGRTLWLLEHEWRTGSVSSRRSVWMTFVIWEIAEPGLPDFSLRRKSPPVVQALANVVRAILFLPFLLFFIPHKAHSLRAFAPADNDHDFSEDFARLYQVTGDAEAIRNVFTREVQAGLCQQPLPGDLVAIDRMLIWQAAGHLAPWNLNEKLDVALQLRQLLVP